MPFLSRVDWGGPFDGPLSGLGAEFGATHRLTHTGLQYVLLIWGLLC